MPSDLAPAAASAFAVKPSNSSRPSFLEEDLASYKPSNAKADFSYKPSAMSDFSFKPSLVSNTDLPAINRGIKANEVNRRTDWAAKYGSK